MSNHQNHNSNPVNGGNGAAPDNGGGKQEKQSIGVRVMKARDKVMASKAGRIVVRGLKVLGIGGLAYASYKAGAKSVKPTTIYIHQGIAEENEEPVEQNEPAEETEEE